MTTRHAHLDGADLCFETFGVTADPTVLLIGGMSASMDVWEPAFCARLADRGRHVVRYDHRDTGASTQWPAGAPGYSSDAFTTDAIGLLESCDIGRAHVVGVSMGGGIAQEMAARIPDRLDSITLIATSPAGARRDDTELPPPTPALRAAFTSPAPEPDWNDEAAVVEHLVDSERPYAGGLGFDEERSRRIARIVVARTPDVRAATINHAAAEHGGSPPFRLTELAVPTMVVHGTDDPLFPFAHGQALAAEIPGAVLVAIEGMGHEHPPPAVWDLVIAHLVGHTG